MLNLREMFLDRGIPEEHVDSVLAHADVILGDNKLWIIGMLGDIVDSLVGIYFIGADDDCVAD